LLDHQNNYVERLSVADNVGKSFNILAISLNVLHNCFEGPRKIQTKLFTDLYLDFLDTLGKNRFSMYKGMYGFRTSVDVTLGFMWYNAAP